MPISGIVIGWTILTLMAVVAENGNSWQATNAQLVALVVLIALNVVTIRSFINYAAYRLRKR